MVEAETAEDVAGGLASEGKGSQEEPGPGSLEEAPVGEPGPPPFSLDGARSQRLAEGSRARRSQQEAEASSSGAEASSDAPLDVARSFLHAMLEPLRERLTKRVQCRLQDYDESMVFPRCEDGRHGNRDGLEVHLRNEALKELRAEIIKHCTRGPRTGQVWKIIGGAGKGGIIARSSLDFGSTPLQRVSTGAWIEELDLVGERLHYNLLKGSGPQSGWVSIRSGEKVLAERVDNLPPSVVAACRRARETVAPPASVCREAAAVAEENAVAPGDSRQPARVVILALMAAHIGTASRLLQLQRALATIRDQELSFADADLIVSVSWHVVAPELASSVRRTMAEFTSDCGARKSRVATEQPQRLSQFQHLRAALDAAEAELRRRWGSEQGDEIWVLFGDDDDLWHPERVSQYVRAIRTHPLLDGVAVFATTARAVVRSSRPEVPMKMPATAAEVNEALARLDLQRMDRTEKCEAWRKALRSAGANAASLPLRLDLPLEYFDFCPRLRILHEFFHAASPALLAHRYCDLRFDEFLETYPSSGQEMGLEVSFFDPEPHCWMYFYAHAGVSDLALGVSIDCWDEQVNFVGANDGHVSSKVEVEPCDTHMAHLAWPEFRTYEDLGMTQRKLAKYLATFRNVMEITLARSYSRKLDQRVLDGFVCYAVKNSFERFLRRVDPDQRVQVKEMVCKACQRFTVSLAVDFQVGVLWHDRSRVFVPEDDSKSPLAV